MSESMDVEIILHEAKQFLDSHADFPALHNTIKLNGLGQRTKYEYIVDDTIIYLFFILDYSSNLIDCFSCLLDINRFNAEVAI